MKRKKSQGTVSSKKKAAASGRKRTKSAKRAETTAETARKSTVKAAKKRKKSMLTRQARKAYEDALLNLREKINKQISFLSAASLNKAGYDIPTDEGADDFERDFALSLLSSENNVMLDIDYALKRIKDGTYGECELCGGQINKSRLQAVPFARTCIDCQAKMEKDKPHFHRFGSTMTTGDGRASEDEVPAGSDE